MTRKANRPKVHKERKAPIDAKALEKAIGGKQPINLFACPDCELLIFEYPDTDSINCPWCRRRIDVHVRYSYVAFAEGVQFSRTFGGESARAVLVE